ncbi:MAG: glycosyltransferase [Melioribacteraceae bacterium]
MKVLIFGNYSGGKVFFDELIEWLSKVGLTVDMYDWGKYELHIDNFSSKISLSPKLKVLENLANRKYFAGILKVFFAKLILNKIKYKYDVIDIHYGNANNIKYLSLLKRKGNKLITSIWGSDFHRLPNEARNKAKELYDNVNYIIIGNPEVKNEFVKYFDDYEYKIRSAGFGDNKLETLYEEVSNDNFRKYRKKYSLDINSLVITCGYKAFHVLQHYEMIDAIEKIKENLPQDYLLIFPLTYHKNEEYIRNLKKRLAESGLKYLVLEDYLTDQEVIEIRIISDIYITIPKSDHASSSFVEYLMANNIVVAGDWLPYKMHYDMGLYFESTSIFNLPTKLSDVIRDLPAYKLKVKENRDIVLNNFSWKNRINNWKIIYEE